MSERSGSGVTPLNFAVFLDFSYSELEEVITYLFGESLELKDGEEPGRGMALREDFDFANDKTSWRHLRRFLTFRHEALHVRHLAGGVLGMVLFFVGGTQYQLMAKYLRQWGVRLADEPLGDLTLPLLTSRAGDPEIEKIESLRTNHGAMLAVVMGGLGDVKLLESASEARTLLDFVAEKCTNVFGLSEAPTDIVADPWDAPLEPRGLTGRAVLEGLARSNEYLLTVHLGANEKTLDLLFKKKHKGVYALAIEMVHQELELPYLRATLATAYLADWALQAPWLPFLLRGRDNIQFQELLPGWRFLRLVEGCKARRLTDEDLARDPEGIADALFDDLGWESPRRLAERVLAAELPEPRFVLSRHYARCLEEGARVRLATPQAFVMPQQFEGTHLLEPVYFLFRDRIMPGTTGLLTEDPRYQQLLTLLIDDALVDDLLIRDDLSLSTVIAEKFYKFATKDAEGALDEAVQHIERQLEIMIGPEVARRILDVVGPLRQPEVQDVEALAAQDKRAQTLIEQGDYVEGTRLLSEQVIPTSRRILGGKHTFTLKARNNYAHGLGMQGEYEAAYRVEAEVLKIRLAEFGEEDPETLQAMNNLAYTLGELDRHEEAKALYEKALNLYRRVHSDEHPGTLTLMTNLARLAAKMERHDEAEKLQRVVWEARQRSLGDEDVETLSVMESLALTLTQTGQLDEASDLFEKALELRARQDGPHDPKTTLAAYMAYGVFKGLGKLENASAVRDSYLDWLLSGEPGALDPTQLEIRKALSAEKERSAGEAGA